MAAVSCSLCAYNSICRPLGQQKLHRSFCQGVIPILDYLGTRKKANKTHPSKRASQFYVFAASENSTKSSKSEESVPSWARPDADEPPPWARSEGTQNELKEGFEVPFYVYLLASAVTAIAAIGSIFEFVNQNPVFGVLNSDSIFYAPLLGFFALTGVPTSAFLWYKSVQAANKEAEEQDKRDGFR